jgi:drug/metabolite transporter (DMT)-like permease
MSTASSQAAAVRHGVMLAFLGAAAFSLKAIFAKLAYRYPGVDAIILLMYRMLFALPFFIGMGWQASRGQAPLSRRDWWTIFLMAFLGYYVSSFTDFLGLQYITASLERLILYLYPTMVLLMGWLVFKQRMFPAQIGGMLVSYLGVIVVFSQELEVAGSHVALGTSLVFVSALSYALYLVVSGRIVARVGSLRLVSLATSIACFLSIAQFLLTKPLSAAIVPLPVIGLSMLNGIACTVIPVTLTMLAIERIGAARVSQIGMVGPLATIGLSVLWLDEPFTLWLLGGTSLVLCGIYITNRRRA